MKLNDFDARWNFGEAQPRRMAQNARTSGRTATQLFFCRYPTQPSYRVLVQPEMERGLGKHFEDESPGFMSKMRRGRNSAAHFAVPLTL
jgi:hypothetical protein